MRKLLLFLLIFSACGGNTVVEDTSTTSTLPIKYIINDLGNCVYTFEQVGPADPDYISAVILSEANTIKNELQSSCSLPTTTKSPTTTRVEGELIVEMVCLNTQGKSNSATISVSVSNPTSQEFSGYVNIKPGYDENFWLNRVDTGLRKTTTIKYEYDPQESSTSGKDYYTAKVYSIDREENTEKVVAQCSFDRNYANGQTSPDSTQPTTTTTSTTTTTVPVTSTTAASTYNYDSSTHRLVNFSNLVNMPPNPYLCEIPRTGLREFYLWGRCLSFYNGVFPNFENSLVEIWYDGTVFSTEDPYPICYWKGEVEDCNVVRRLEAKEASDRSRELIQDSIENAPP
tara:strand:- start:305 stop:1333 length:1029 start_codon:yes stop_codon:yes gene_type:complete